MKRKKISRNAEHTRAQGNGVSRETDYDRL